MLFYVVAEVKSDDAFGLRCGHARMFLSKEAAQKELKMLQELHIETAEIVEGHVGEVSTINPGEGLGIYEVLPIDIRRVKDGTD